MIKRFILLTIIVAYIQGCTSDSSETSGSVEDFIENDSLFIVTTYEKAEHRIPMRDGVTLFTSVYAPTDKSVQYPIILVRTPYSVAPYGTTKGDYKTSLGPNMLLARDKYIFVYQDVRGQFMSEGTFVNMKPHSSTNEEGKSINESTDTFDTIDWLIKNLENNNGKVGQWGISYPGFYTAAGMIDSHPALVAASPQAPIADWFWDDFHHHGAFFLPHTFNFLTVFDQPKHGLTKEWPERFQYNTEDGYDFYMDIEPLSKAKEKYLGDSLDFWNEITQHPNYDQFWQDKNILPHLKNINCAVLTVGGWFDAEDLYGPLNIYKEIEENNPISKNAIVMGPWSHGGWRRTDGSHLGNVHFGGKHSEFYNTDIITPFFAHHLKAKENPKLPEAYMFETGTNKWRTFDSWPPEGLTYKNLYFKQNSALSYTPPRANEYGTDVFISDPWDPVPYVEEIPTKMTKEYMTDDQKFLLNRDDVLYYQTGVLSEDLTVAGPIDLNISVSTDQSAADWVVKIIDVYPSDHPSFPHQPDKSMANYHQMVRSDVLRGRFRNSYETPEAFTPKETATINIQLQDVLHTFKKGHRVMVQVQSSWFPIVDINPQKYVENIFEAKTEDFVKATHRIGRHGVAPSYVRIGILNNIVD